MKDLLILITIEEFLGMSPTKQDERGYVWYYENGFISLETKIKELWFVDIEEQIDLKTFYALHHLCSLNGYKVSGYVMVDKEPQKVW